MEKLSLTGVNKHGTPDDFAALSAVILTGDDIFLDNGAIHGKSRVERGIQFTARSPEEVAGGERIFVVWVTLKRAEAGMGYNGVCASQLIVNREAAVGYKSMPELVNKMDHAMKGKLELEILPDADRTRLGEFLKQFRGGELWACAQPGVQSLFVL
ncbi:MAG: hypothetical protein JWN30_2884 [Bacilli bacterium]|nr:hypothetical protein [Bacilli bacterium]